MVGLISTVRFHSVSCLDRKYGLVKIGQVQNISSSKKEISVSTMERDPSLRWIILHIQPYLK